MFKRESIEIKYLESQKTSTTVLGEVRVHFRLSGTPSDFWVMVLHTIQRERQGTLHARLSIVTKRVVDERVNALRNTYKDVYTSELVADFPKSVNPTIVVQEVRETIHATNVRVPHEREATRVKAAERLAADRRHGELEAQQRTGLRRAVAEAASDAGLRSESSVRRHWTTIIFAIAGGVCLLYLAMFLH